LGAFCWIALIVLDLLVLFSTINNVESGIAPVIPRLIFSLFALALYAFFRFSVVKAESINFMDLLWRVFLTGLLTTLASLSIKLIFMLFEGNKLAENVFLINIFYHINLGLVTAFLVSTFVVWQRLILYQKTKFLIKTWMIFQYILLGSVLIYILAGLDPYSIPFFVTFGILLLGSLVLSVNLKWVAYLNFRQKWKSILYLLLVVIYLVYFYLNLSQASNNQVLSFDLFQIVFIQATFSFIFIYSIFSLLVILFNLPTSSVFEQKLKEAMNFQRLSQSIPTGENEEQVYNILLDSAVSAVLANAAWLEVENKKVNKNVLVTRSLDDIEVQKIKNDLEGGRIRYLSDSELDQNLKSRKFIVHLKSGPYKSAIILPLVVKETPVGMLVLLKDVADAFNKEMIEIINTFANQASISIENFRLISEAIENERYKEEIKIAKRVQKSLLPAKLEQNEKFSLAAFSGTADEVGGDYYDNFRINKHKLALIIGDVSGKGTSAAFTMSQMKGVFHSLAQLDLTPKEFIIRANQALSSCLEKTTFITSSFFVIDTKNSKVEFVRAGHCPTLYYKSKQDQTCFFQTQGLGLGIIRNSNFTKYVQTNSFEFQKGDIMVLYTDGIVEAKNETGEDYGYERLKEIVQANVKDSPTELQEKIITDLTQFCGNQPLDDDYTSLIIKFN